MPHTGIWFDFVAVPAALISRILLVMNLLAFLSLPARELIPSHRPVIPNRLRMVAVLLASLLRPWAPATSPQGTTMPL